MSSLPLFANIIIDTIIHRPRSYCQIGKCAQVTADRLTVSTKNPLPARQATKLLHRCRTQIHQRWHMLSMPKNIKKEVRGSQLQWIYCYWTWYRGPVMSKINWCVELDGLIDHELNFQNFLYILWVSPNIAVLQITYIVENLLST